MFSPLKTVECVALKKGLNSGNVEQLNLQKDLQRYFRKNTYRYFILFVESFCIKRSMKFGAGENGICEACAPLVY